MKTKIQNPGNKEIRLTPVRQGILKILEKEGSPLTVPEIQTLLKEKGLFPNKTTLYRQMEKLLENNIVESISLKNTVVHYEKKSSHHHHFICSTCKNITCIEDENFECAARSLEKSLEKNGFLVKNHNFSLEGKCQKCLAF